MPRISHNKENAAKYFEYSFDKYPKGSKAPYSLLQLALLKILNGELKEGCNIYNLIRFEFNSHKIIDDVENYASMFGCGKKEIQIKKSIETNAKQAIVIDFDTNEIIFQKNADQRIEPASMTKIMTAYVAFDHIKNYKKLERRSFAQFNFKTIEEAKKFESKIANLSTYSEIINFANNNNIKFNKFENLYFGDILSDISVPLFKLAPNQKSKIIETSIAKIIVVLESINLKNESLMTMDSKCKVSDKSYKMGGSRMFLELNDLMSVEDLIKGMIVQSGNDAAVALAECLFDTESMAVRTMNEGLILSEKNLNYTNFSNVTGWPDENHYSTVLDLAILSNALIKAFPSFYEYFKIKEFTHNDIKQPNRNKLLSSVEGVDGLKTGYTKKSGWGVAVSALREGRRITVVLSGTNSSKSRFEETSKLLDWAFTHTFQKKSQTKKKDFCEIYPKASSCISSIDKEDTASDILQEVSKPVF